MTRATHRPLRRLVEGGQLGPLVVELVGGMMVVRPYRARKPLIEATYAEVVRAVLLQRAPRSRKRGGR